MWLAANLRANVNFNTIRSTFGINMMLMSVWCRRDVKLVCTPHKRVSIALSQQLKSVINAGIGIDYTLNDKISFAGSFITDFSAIGKIAV